MCQSCLFLFRVLVHIIPCECFFIVYLNRFYSRPWLAIHIYTLLYIYSVTATATATAVVVVGVQYKSIYYARLRARTRVAPSCAAPWWFLSGVGSLFVCVCVVLFLYYICYPLMFGCFFLPINMVSIIIIIIMIRSPFFLKVHVYHAMMNIFV